MRPTMTWMLATKSKVNKPRRYFLAICLLLKTVWNWRGDEKRREKEEKKVYIWLIKVVFVLEVEGKRIFACGWANEKRTQSRSVNLMADDLKFFKALFSWFSHLTENYFCSILNLTKYAGIDDGNLSEHLLVKFLACSSLQFSEFMYFLWALDL